LPQGSRHYRSAANARHLEAALLDAKAREALKGFSDGVGRSLAKVGFTANVLTALGVVISAIASWRIAAGAFLSAGILLTFGGFLDFCDGAVARVKGTASTFGAFLDSVTDRFSDAFVFSALIWFFFQDGDTRTAAVALAAYAGGTLTSYIRAKAESLDYDCKVGLLERAERLILVCAGLILGFVEIMLWVVAVLAMVTVIQRLVHVSRQARSPG
jgi:CDP-diacylglycerol---glycerol-3-phosphate 3-phosphatidyltransferase